MKKGIKAWAVSLNGRLQWRENESGNYLQKELMLFFSRNQASDVWGEWHYARKKKNRRFILNKGVRLVEVSIIPERTSRRKLK